MKISYQNNKGETYFLHSKLTTKKNFRYFFSKKDDDSVLSEIPTGYQIYENDNGQVFLRRSENIMFTSNDLQRVEEVLKNLQVLFDYKLELRKQGIIIYLPEINLEHLEGTLTLNIKKDYVELTNFSSGAAMNFVPSLKLSVDNKPKNPGKKFLAERFDVKTQTWSELGHKPTLLDLVDYIPEVLDKNIFHNLKIAFAE